MELEQRQVRNVVLMIRMDNQPLVQVNSQTLLFFLSINLSIYLDLLNVLAALRAGVPTIITPVFLDQFDNAYAINKLHVGIGIAKQLQKISADDLSAAIRQVLSDPTFAKNAKEIGIKMRSSEEDGTKRMVEEVEMFWKDKVTTGTFLKDLAKVRTQVDEWSQEHHRRQHRKQRWIKSIAGCTVLVAIAAIGVEYARW